MGWLALAALVLVLILAFLGLRAVLAWIFAADDDQWPQPAGRDGPEPLSRPGQDR